MNLRMMGKKVLVQQDNKETTTKGGIILAEIDSQKAVPRGTVLGVGPDVKAVKKGDRVIWGDYAGQVIAEKPVTRVMMEEDILAVEL